MAIDRGVTLEVGVRSDRRVRLANERRGLGGREFDIASSIPAWSAGDWGNYAWAALQGLFEAGYEPAGFDAFVSSDLPLAAGLSSSSALVVAIAAAGLAAAGRPLDGRLELAGLLARAERYVGVRGGGMDQAAILAGRRGHALRIDFEPLRVRPVAVPEGWAFVVAHSLVEAEKAGAARETYNRRRAEVERALEAAGKRLDAEAPSYATLRSTHSLDELLEVGVGLPAPLASRFRHVLTEARRVEAAEARLAASDAPGFGTLLLESHASLRDEFEVSTPELDALVAAALDAGADGARLTGAGLGGCVVALVPVADVDSFRSALGAGFYRPRGVAELDDRLFRVRPAAGAAVAPAGDARAT